jgi:uncharacterized membrane protein YraQ (UPF0718 family)
MTTIAMNTWHFLNENLVSGIICALVFGVIAALLFRNYEQHKNRAELIGVIKELLNSQIKENLDVCHQIQEALKKGRTKFFPAPFRTSGFEVVLEGGFVRDVKTEIAKSIIDSHDKLLVANRLHTQLLEYVIGINSTLTQSQSVRDNVSKYLELFLPDLEKELKNLKALLS